MSEPKRALDRKALRRRRVALAVHLALGACLAAGALGTWWRVFVKDEPRWSTGGWDRQRATPVEPLAALAVLAAATAFFFASFDLAADADIQAPVLAASLAALVVAGALTYRYVRDPHLVQSIHQEVQRAGGDVAGVGTSIRTRSGPGVLEDSDPPVLRSTSLLDHLSVRRAWGLTLVQAAAPLMVLVSVYLTFLAERAPEST